MKPKTKLLFVCSANMDRSPTAASLFKASDKFEAKSAGILPFAVNHIDQNLLDWADIVFVLNEKDDKHLTHLKENYSIAGKRVYDLDVPDVHKRGSQDLVTLLKEKISEFLDEPDINLWK